MANSNNFTLDFYFLFRAKYAQRFSQLLSYSSDVPSILPEIWSFFECVLDDNFLELETHISLPNLDLNSKLIPTIASRAPLLEKLKIDFQVQGRGL